MLAICLPIRFIYLLQLENLHACKTVGGKSIVHVIHNTPSHAGTFLKKNVKFIDCAGYFRYGRNFTCFLYLVFNCKAACE